MERREKDLAALVVAASATKITPAQRELQIASLAYGNAKLENDRVSRPRVVDAVRASQPKK